MPEPAGGERSQDRRPAAAGVIVLEPGETSPDVYLQREFTIKELSENFTAKQAGQELPHKVLGTVTAEDDRDNGSTDRWETGADRLPSRAGPRPGRSVEDRTVAPDRAIGAADPGLQLAAAASAHPLGLADQGGSNSLLRTAHSGESTADQPWSAPWSVYSVVWSGSGSWGGKCRSRISAHW